jgi:hypothetical protein
MPIQFLVAGEVVFEYDDYLRPPVSPQRQEELRLAMQKAWELARASGTFITFKHVHNQKPEELKFQLVSYAEVKES